MFSLGQLIVFVNTWCITFEDNSSHILVKLHTSNSIYELRKNNSINLKIV